MVGAVAKMIVTVSTMFKSAFLQKMIFSIGVFCAAVAAYLGGVMLLRMDKTLSTLETWILSGIVTPTVIVILTVIICLSYLGFQKWWKWVKA